MTLTGLEGKTAAILVADNFHVLETFYPYFRLREAGARVVFVGARAGDVYHDAGGEPAKADLSAEDALARQFDLIYCPGGFAPLGLRRDPKMLELARNHFDRGGLFAAICHAASFLVSMGILRGRKATCYKSQVDDLVNAGAEYVDNAPVVDGNLITARMPADLPVFMEAAVAAMKGEQQPETALTGTKAAVLVESRYQIHQVWYSYFRLESNHVDTVLIGPDDSQTIFSRCSNYPLTPDMAISSGTHTLYDAIVVPGDWAADKMRIESPFLDFVRKHYDARKTIASIAEGHSVLISAGLLHGRNVAAPAEMRPDIENARGLWAGPGTFVDGNLVSAGSTDNLPDFLSALITGMQLQ